MLTHESRSRGLPNLFIVLLSLTLLYLGHASASSSYQYGSSSSSSDGRPSGGSYHTSSSGGLSNEDIEKIIRESGLSNTGGSVSYKYTHSSSSSGRHGGSHHGNSGSSGGLSAEDHARLLNSGGSGGSFNGGSGGSFNGGSGGSFNGGSGGFPSGSGSFGGMNSGSSNFPSGSGNFGGNNIRYHYSSSSSSSSRGGHKKERHRRNLSDKSKKGDISNLRDILKSAKRGLLSDASESKRSSEAETVGNSKMEKRSNGNAGGSYGSYHYSSSSSSSDGRPSGGSYHTSSGGLSNEDIEKIIRESGLSKNGGSLSYRYTHTSQSDGRQPMRSVNIPAGASTEDIAKIFREAGLTNSGISYSYSSSSSSNGRGDSGHSSSSMSGGRGDEGRLADLSRYGLQRDHSNSDGSVTYRYSYSSSSSSTQPRRQTYLTVPAGSSNQDVLNILRQYQITNVEDGSNRGYGGGSHSSSSHVQPYNFTSSSSSGQPGWRITSSSSGSQPSEVDLDSLPEGPYKDELLRLINSGNYAGGSVRYRYSSSSSSSSGNHGGSHHGNSGSSGGLSAEELSRLLNSGGSFNGGSGGFPSGSGSFGSMNSGSSSFPSGSGNFGGNNIRYHYSSSSSSSSRGGQKRERQLKDLSEKSKATEILKVSEIKKKSVREGPMADQEKIKRNDFAQLKALSERIKRGCLTKRSGCISATQDLSGRVKKAEVRKPNGLIRRFQKDMLPGSVNLMKLFKRDGIKDQRHLQPSETIKNSEQLADRRQRDKATARRAMKARQSADGPQRTARVAAGGAAGPQTINWRDSPLDRGDRDYMFLNQYAYNTGGYSPPSQPWNDPFYRSSYEPRDRDESEEPVPDDDQYYYNYYPDEYYDYSRDIDTIA